MILVSMSLVPIMLNIRVMLITVGALVDPSHVHPFSAIEEGYYSLYSPLETPPKAEGGILRSDMG